MVSRDVLCYESFFPFSTQSIPTYDPTHNTQPTSQTHSPSLSRHKPTRQLQKPLWLKDYVHHTPSPAVCGNEHEVLNVSTIEPASFQQANQLEASRQAMRAELEALHKNQTWVITDLLDGVRLISCKWVYMIKKNSDGTINKFKARLVAKGFLQAHSINYHDSFTPVAKVVTIRVLIAHVVNQGWDMHQMDINNVFLHGNLSEKIYLKPPQGLEVPTSAVCKL